MKKCGKLKRSATLILILSHRFLAQPIAPDPQQQCSNNPACVTLKFEGSCCPTDDFRWLDCCSEKNKSDERISVNRSLLSAQCSQYSGCAHLANDCCPTRDGVMLVSSCRMTNLKIQIVLQIRNLFTCFLRIVVIRHWWLHL
jgi:hypothetical protein